MIVTQKCLIATCYCNFFSLIFVITHFVQFVTLMLQIHRRKIRAWQIICVLSPFVEDDIVGKVLDFLYLSLTVS